MPRINWHIFTLVLSVSEKVGEIVDEDCKIHWY